MASSYMRRVVNQADDRIRERERRLRTSANKLRGNAAWLRRVGDDAAARELEGIAAKLKDDAAELLSVRKGLIAALADDELEDTLIHGGRGEKDATPAADGR